MAPQTQTLSSPASDMQTAPRQSSAIARLAFYLLARGAALLGIVIVSVYVTILVTNKSVVIDDEMAVNPSPIRGWFAGISNPQVAFRADAEFTAGTFFQQSLRLLFHGLTFNIENTRVVYWQSSRQFDSTRAVILDSLPRTLLVFGSANLLLFGASLGIALLLARRPANWLNRLILVVAPVSGLPPWIYGLVITVFALQVLHVSTGGLLDRWPEEFSWSFVRFALRIITPAVLAIFLSKIFQTALAWRSFLLVFAGEDYVELARAKGLPPGVVERRYLLRPVLPALLTSFVILLISIWQDAIVVELFFGVAGIGHVFYNAIRYRDMALIVSLTVTFAYLVALSVLILDIAYALVDPRVKIGAAPARGRAVRGPGRRPVRWPRTGAAFAPQPVKARAAFNPRAALTRLFQFGRGSLARLRALRALRAPAPLAGLCFLLALVAVSLYTVVAVPYPEAVRLWNHDSAVWATRPQKALPEWINLFRQEDLPRSLTLSSQADPALKTVTALSDDVKEIVLTFAFDYPYAGFPQALVLNIDPQFAAKRPFVSLAWLTPDGRELSLGDFSFDRPQNLIFAQSLKLPRELAGTAPEVSLFTDPGAPTRRALPGRYTLRVEGLVFEAAADLDAEFRLFGQVYGWAGTDHQRRDTLLALAWGAPVALAFGLLGAVATTFLTVLVAAAGAWFGGWVDGLAQRLTEINLILPAFPILLILYNFYTKSLWVLLGVVVLLGIFGSALKTYRAAFLQIKEAPYVEAARAYGASDLRLIGHYLVPRILPLLIPQLILTVPTYVYLEATLAFLNMSDPLLPTWGKLIQGSIANGGLTTAPHTLLLPAGILLLTAGAFMLVGYALERVLNPRLADR
jgi:peptide/nickel transport system permease protein